MFFFYHSLLTRFLVSILVNGAACGVYRGKRCGPLDWAPELTWTGWLIDSSASQALPCENDLELGCTLDLFSCELRCMRSVRFWNTWVEWWIGGFVTAHLSEHFIEDAIYESLSQCQTLLGFCRTLSRFEKNLYKVYLVQGSNFI